MKTTMNPEFILRPWNAGDLPHLVKFANNRNIAKYMTNQFPHPYTREAGARFITFANSNNPVLIFAIEIEGIASGGIGLHPQQDIYSQNAELGYWLAEPFWNRGIITNAVKQIVEFGFATLSVQRIFARPFGSNQASQKVLEKSGFLLEAKMEKVLFKNGVYEDELIYAIRRSG